VVKGSVVLQIAAFVLSLTQDFFGKLVSDLGIFKIENNTFAGH
jgi:hypothetical protein